MGGETMEIKKVYGDVNPYSTQKLTENQRVQQEQPAQEAAATQPAGDTVALSNQARLLATAMTVAQSAPDVRSDKVRELKAQVQNGTYKPDVKKAAANLLREEISLSKG